MLERLRIKLGLAKEDTDKMSLLKICIEDATNDAMNITNQTKEYVEQHLAITIVDIAVLIYNRIGTEGLVSQSVSGMSESYMDDLPKNLKKILYAHRRLRR